MRLAFAERAARDLEDIIDYIAFDSPAVAENVYRAIVAAAERLCDFPEAGRPGRLPKTRERTVVSLPHIIVYQARDDVVTVSRSFMARVTWRGRWQTGGENWTVDRAASQARPTSTH
jgi:toxin ParE1/3/4